jgi:hypothetical protein
MEIASTLISNKGTSFSSDYDVPFLFGRDGRSIQLNIYPKKVQKLVYDTGSCWLWRKHLTPDGYAQKAIGSGSQRTRTMAHRWFYQYVFGSIPEGLVLDHLCCVKRCVNPNHLEAVTNQENIQRHYERNR